LSNLDAKLRLEMRQEIRRIHAGLGSITLYVTHDQDEALSLADRIVVLRDGEIRQIGTPEELYQRPATLDVAEFMGFRNRLAGELNGAAGDTVTLDVGGEKLTGSARENLAGRKAIAAIRPEDLLAGEHGFPAVVDICEYRGHAFFGAAKGPGGSEVFFRSDTRMNPGEKVRLAADPARVLVFNEVVA
jgi:putative spermidine/putrescine transport system ATP-binding protein